MARMEARVNLRLSQEVYDTYAKVGGKFNTSVTEMIREMVNDGVEIMQTIATIIDAAEAGDKQAAAKLLNLFMQSNEGRLELAKAVMDQEMKSFLPESVATELATDPAGETAGRASNTSR
jgi:DNA-binding GntR family transcriptional regulator